MTKKFKIQVHFTGTAIVELSGDSVEDVRRAVAELELPDIARVGFADILTFDMSVREITPARPESGQDDADGDASHKPRPSGWYRPH